MDTVKDRLIKFIAYLEIGQGKFEKLCGLSNGFVSNIKDGFSTPNLTKIAHACPDLNLDWLITGNGPMLKEASKESTPVLVAASETRPRIPYTAAAGSLTNEMDGISESQCEQVPVIRALPAYDFTIFIKGDSMFPRFESGDEVACKKISNTHFLQWGKVHVLDTTQGIIIKRIYEDGEKIRCVSYNPEYPDFSVPKEEIYSMSLVVGLVRV